MDEVDRLVQQVRAARDALALDRHASLVDELEGVGAGDPRVELIVEVERIRDVAFHPLGEDGWRTALATVNDLLAHDLADDAMPARLRLAAAGLRARLKEPGWATGAAREYEASARAFSRAGDLDGAAKAIGQCSWSLDLLVSGLRRARSRMAQSIQLAESSAVRVGALTQLTKIDVWLGDLDAADENLAVCHADAGDHADATVAYIAWADINVLAARGDVHAVRAALARADAHASSWYGTVTGVQFESQMADVLAGLDLKDEAWERLERALARRDEDDEMVISAELAVHARIGDPEVALDRWKEIRRSPLLEPWERARLGLLAACAMQRLDLPAGPTAAAAFDEAATHARTDMLLVRERGSALAVLDDAVASGSLAAARLRRALRGHRLAVLTAVEVTDPDGVTTPVTGRAATLLIALAAEDGPMSPLRLGQSIWPEDEHDDELPARVRRLVHRVRQVAPIVERDETGRLFLSGDTAVDLRDLETTISQLRAAGAEGLETGHLADARQLAMSTDAATLATRTEVPLPVRARLSRLLHWVHRRAAEFEQDRGRDDLARREMRRALAHGPDDDAAAALLARSLVAEGRRVEASEVLRATAAYLEEAGIRPSRTFADAAALILAR